MSSLSEWMENDDQPLFGASQLSHMPLRIDMKAKRINCPIHDTMRFSPKAIAIIDTPHFQRLRELRQLGLTSFIFPTANHTRFEHSLGVYHLAEMWSRRLQQQTCRDSYRITEEDVECISLAGLCHDLGHGPFSHAFDHELLRRLDITTFVHEEMSCKILRDIVDTVGEVNGEPLLTEDQVKTIELMIKIKPEGRKSLEGDERRYLFDIVSNKQNSVDVDKFDYLARDSRAVEVPISFKHDRVFEFSRVVDNDICFRRSEYPMIHKLFVSREDMHRSVYTHPKVKSIEFMMCDALVAVNPLFKFSERIHSVEDFLTMDDTIIRQIEGFKKNLSCCKGHVELEDDEERALEEALALIGRIRDRKLYCFVAEQKIPPRLFQRKEGESNSKKTDEALAELLKDFKASEILSCHSGQLLKAEDIICSENNINFSMKDRNPLDRVKFFHRDIDLAHYIPSSDASHMMTSVFQERTLRIYSKTSDERVCDAISVAFTKWCHNKFGLDALATPLKQVHQASQGVSQHQVSLEPIEEESQSQGGSRKRARSLALDFEAEGQPE